MGQFKPGNTIGKGRPPGAKNKRTEQWEQFVEYCMTGGLDKFRKALDSLKDKDYIEAYLKLLEYHQPKLQRSEVEQTNTGERIITVVYENKQNGQNNGLSAPHGKELP